MAKPGLSLGMTEFLMDGSDVGWLDHCLVRHRPTSPQIGYFITVDDKFL
jgi:hypothetical protein